MSESESSTIPAVVELRKQLAGAEAELEAYRTGIETAVRLREKIDLEKIDELDAQAGAARVLAESRS